jgi:hypothetical protein
MEGLSRYVSNFISGSGVVGATAMQAVAAATPDTTVKISVGDCLIGNANPTGTSTFYYSGWVTAQDSVTISANSSGNPRIDCVVAYVNVSAASSATSDNPGVMQFMAVAGTPAVSPVAPVSSVIQTAVGASNPFIILANVAVANGFTQITNGNITDVRAFPYISPASSTVRRQGGDANDFTVPGTTGYSESNLLTQAGSVTGASGTMTVTFPVAFSQKPTVLITPRGSGGVFSGGFYLVSETTASFNIQVSATNVPPSFNWMAVGRR